MTGQTAGVATSPALPLMNAPFRRAAAAALAIACTLPLALRAQVSTPPVTSQSGMVVSTSGIASDIGAAILARGGNAVDAAVATAFALAVTYPSAGNIGGGGFMVVRTPAGEAITIDYREVAPLASTPTMYLDSAGRIVGRMTSTGWMAPGVPGTVRGMETAHKRFGKLPWRDVVLPAAELAERGFVLTPSLARSINGEVSRGMAPYPSSVAAYGKPGGGEWQPGDTIVLRDLGRSIRAIATDGPDAFYTGWIADSIDAAMRANGGIITRRDLAQYQARVREPVRGTYKGYEIISMPPPSSGGVALVQMLNILEPFDLRAMGQWSAESQHLQIEAMRRAYLDRARFLGDPDFVQVPVDRLTSKEHARQVAATIDRQRASRSAELGADILSRPAGQESDETTHFSVVDRDGMAVANTYTLEAGYGSHVVVPGTGMILNNEMGDFNRRPGYTDSTGVIGTPANLIAPGKRMLSSMTPTIVTRDGQLVLVTGSPGGRTIINTVFNIVLNVVEFGMDARQAVDAPRLHHQWMPDVATYERDALTQDVIDRLGWMGHTIRVGGGQGDGHTIYYDARTRTATGAADARTADSRASRPDR
jgi:gamma-glutamyltranspeptidase / glutathione hydrolase